MIRHGLHFSRFFRLKSLVWFGLICIALPCQAEPVLSDTLQEISVTAIKSSALRFQPVAATDISQMQVQRLNIMGIKGVSELAPNFYMPDYGSQMTSSIYVRGIGARMDQAAVGLNIDNIPFLTKDAYDMDLADIERVEVIRGPQSSLYGRNAMAGMVNVYTISPLTFQGVRVSAIAGMHNDYRGAASWYSLPSEKVGLMLGGQYGYFGGTRKNVHSGENADSRHNLSLRQRTDLHLSDNLRINNVLIFSDCKQNGYPYAYEQTRQINYNDTCYYKRLSITDGLTIKYHGPKFTLASITSFQYLDDDMTLDQDFLPLNYFNITQRRWERGVTQDLVIRGDVGNYNWLAGVFGFYKHQTMRAPVRFKDDGIANLIEQHRNEMNPQYPIKWDERDLFLNSFFGNTTKGVAFYHRSSYRWNDYSVQLGLRLDVENAALDYRSVCNSSYTIYHNSEIFSNQPVDINDKGRLSHTYTQFLPTLTLTRSFGESMVYLTAGKGYKSGGFNNQMFSDVLQQRIMQMLSLSLPYNIDEIVAYKPETSMNYEAGLHVNCAEGHVHASLAAFYIDVRNQQLTMFPPGSITGRIMTNAGKTHSYGAELSFLFSPGLWDFNLAYGYTHARFAQYNNGKQDFKGKQVPYAPSNTLFLSAARKFSYRDYQFMIDVNLRGIGEIYWDEANTTRQPFYSLLGAEAGVSHGIWSAQIWGKNLTDTNFNTFRYVSMGNTFFQQGASLSVGVTLKLLINN